MISSDAVTALCREANDAPNCVGLMTWCHTFSPSKMWINGLRLLKKPLLHLHTQYNRDIPWSTIDMDFMNLNQAAHGDREHGFIMARLRLNRKVVVGYWKEKNVQEKLGAWARAAAAWADWQGAKFVRLGDNMREVAVTEGDKVGAQIKFGFAVNGYGVATSSADERVHGRGCRLCKEYEDGFTKSPVFKKEVVSAKSIREAARIELGLRAFLTDGNFKGFTTTFEDLHGLVQLPGLAPQRLMADNYGFAGEGDWKTARCARHEGHGRRPAGRHVVHGGLHLHLQPQAKLVLGAHMLEICPSIADGKPSLPGHPLGIGARPIPRVWFSIPARSRLNAALMDFGNRFRLLINEVECRRPDHKMPKLPVAGAVWQCRPNFEDASPRGFMQAAHITLASARPLPQKCSKTLAQLPVSKWL